MKRFRGVLCILLAVVMAVSLMIPAGAEVPKRDCCPIVFVAGLGAYGEDDGLNKIVPVWGMMAGSMAKYLEEQGYEAATASIGPFSGSWDRTCELYAHLTGTRTDYGAAHAAAHGHARYGPTYERALVPGWNNTDRKAHLIGYSFGGNTLRYFAQMLKDGSPEERAATPADDLSPLFSGELDGRIASITTLGAPHNGTTVFEPEVKKTGALRALLATGLSVANALPLDGLYSMRLQHFGISFKDFWTKPWTVANLFKFFTSESGERADTEMTLDGAAEINKGLECLPDVYYFSYTARMTEDDGKGNQVPKKGMWMAFWGTAKTMGKKVNFTTPGGITVDDSWLPNDGQTNWISALHPFDEPARDYDANNVQPGIWQVMPTLEQDHFDFSGGIKHLFGGTPGTREFYLEMAQMLEATQK